MTRQVMARQVMAHRAKIIAIPVTAK